MTLSDVHPLQADSFFRLYRMPEQTRDLETTASLMRSVFGCGEQNGLLTSKRFSGEIYTRDVEKTVDTLDSCSQIWAGQTLLAEGLAVPPSEREKPARAGSVLTLVPLTPMIAKHSCFTRKRVTRGIMEATSRVCCCEELEQKLQRLSWVKVSQRIRSIFTRRY